MVPARGITELQNQDGSPVLQAPSTHLSLHGKHERPQHSVEGDAWRPHLLNKKGPVSF